GSTRPEPPPLDLRSRRLGSRVEAGKASERCGPADAVLAEPARRVAARVEAGNDVAAQVDDLGAGVDPDARIGVVEGWRGPGRIERRLRDLVHRPRFLEIGIDAGVDGGIVTFHRFAQGRARQWAAL